MKSTLFQRAGGFAKVSKVVTSFYDKVLDSPIVSPYFANTNMKRQIDHQTKFISQIMGGPASYTDEQLERVHAHLAINDVAFMEIVELLRETLEDYDFSEVDIQHVEQEMMNRKSFIIAKI